MLELKVLFYFGYNFWLHRRTTQKFLKLNLSVLSQLVAPSLLKCPESFLIFSQTKSNQKSLKSKCFKLNKHFPGQLKTWSNLLIVTSVLRPLFPPRPLFPMRLVSASARPLTSASTVAAASLSFLFRRPFSLKIKSLRFRKIKVKLPMLL